MKGLAQALHVLKRLDEGKSRDEIVKEFDGDEQIVEIWTSFLAHNGWMSHPDGRWEVTAKGKMWIEKTWSGE